MGQSSAGSVNPLHGYNDIKVESKNFDSERRNSVEIPRGSNDMTTVDIHESEK